MFGDYNDAEDFDNMSSYLSELLNKNDTKSIVIKVSGSDINVYEIKKIGGYYDETEKELIDTYRYERERNNKNGKFF